MARVKELTPGTAIAVTSSGRRGNVYFQDTFGGIREFFYDVGRWSGGHSYKVLFHSKPLSPIAVAEWNDDHDRPSHQRFIHIFTLDKENNIIESCNTDGSNWFDGELMKPHGLKAAPFSKLSAIAWGKDLLRLYYQTSDDHDHNTINELRCSSGGWSEGPPLPTFVKPKPLKGTSIASICWAWGSTGQTRTFYQGEDFKILQASQEQVWSLCSLLLPAPKPYSPLAAVTWFGGEKRHIRLFSLDDGNRLQEYCNDGGDWFQGPLSESDVQAAPYSKLYAIYYGSRVRLYFQPANDDTIKEWCLNFGGDWFAGETLRANPSGWKTVDTDGATYPVGWLPNILNPNGHWHTYDPALIDGVGILVGCFDGKIVGEELKSKQSKILAPNTNDSYTWVYTPGGAILYRYCERDHRPGYTRYTQPGIGQPVICAGEFRIAQGNYLDSVLVIVYGDNGQYKPKESQCLGPVATKLRTLGLSLTGVDWYWREG